MAKLNSDRIKLMKKTSTHYKTATKTSRIKKQMDLIKKKQEQNNKNKEQ